MDIYVADPKKRVSVKAGTFIDSSKSFCRLINSSHIMRVMGNSIGIQESVVHQLIDLECELVYMGLGDGTMYKSKFQDWLAPDIKTRDFGHGVQRFLPVARMQFLETQPEDVCLSK